MVLHIFQKVSNRRPEPDLFYFNVFLKIVKLNYDCRDLLISHQEYVFQAWADPYLMIKPLCGKFSKTIIPITALLSCS